jgi:hypothetical protein
MNVRFRGVVPGGRYRVQYEAAGRREERVGADLLAGIEVTVADAPGAEMVLYGRDVPHSHASS